MKKGELVRLKTGGPSMLIVHLKRASARHRARLADCVWQAGDTFSRGQFPTASLETVDSYDFCMGAVRQGLD